MTSLVSVAYQAVNGTDVFYRQAGPDSPDAPTILLLHGFPTSSFEFRNLMPLLAMLGYRVIAPDFPGYGFTNVTDGYVYTFANLADIIDGFVSALGLKKFAIYIFDYGAPAGLRLALKRPEDILAIVTQNGNAYDEGFDADFWAPIRKYWDSGSEADRDAIRNLTDFAATKWQYTNGSPHPEKIEPETYYLDQTLMDRPGNKEIQLDYLFDYRTNLPLYPAFQDYFNTSGVPVLAMWGKKDEIFVYPGAEAFKRDVKKLEIKPVDAGHFAIETNELLYAKSIDSFFKKFRVFDTHGHH
ncbi:putative hydrolase [Thozetella sp. PMI_491]|nr:putative hydrolase [Thozetella sp. PMI_491]